MLSPILCEPNPEIERTFPLRRKKQRIKEQRRKARRKSNMAEDDQRRTRGDFVNLGVQGITSSIARPTVAPTASNSNWHSFPRCNNLSSTELPLEDPNLHLSIFLEVSDMLKLNRVSSDAIRLCLFTFSLRDKAMTWLHSLSSGCITTWDELTRIFLAKFFPPSKTVSLRNQITNFQ